MPARRRTIDATGEYKITNGSPVDDPTHVSNVILLMRMHRGTCPVLPNQGFPYSDFEKLGDGVERRAEAATKETLLPLTRPKLITDLDVIAEVVGDALTLEISFTDPTGSRRIVQLPISRGA